MLKIGPKRNVERNGINCDKNVTISGSSWSRRTCMESKSHTRQFILLKVHPLTSFAVTFRSSFGDFAQKFGKEERFRNIEKIRERESLFNEYLIEVRRREKEERFQRKEQVSKFRLLGRVLAAACYFTNACIYSLNIFIHTNIFIFITLL